MNIRSQTEKHVRRLAGINIIFPKVGQLNLNRLYFPDSNITISRAPPTLYILSFGEREHVANSCKESHDKDSLYTS